MTDIHKTVASNIRAELARRGMSQQEASDLLGLTRAQVANRLTGVTSLRIDEVEKFAILFDVPFADLVADRGGRR